MKKRLPFKKQIVFGLAASAVVLLVGLPFFAGTGSYPLAIVDGNSMYPSLHNGDLVFFVGHRGVIKNGTEIVFVQGGTGVGALDSFLKPILIHRVIGQGLEPNGVIYYQTKGDNNIAADPFVTDSGNVLGVPIFVIPYVGLPVQFLKTPFGLVTVSALATLYFLSGVDTKMNESNEKKRLIALFARHSLNGEISPIQYERLKLAVEFYDDVPADLLVDPTIISTIDWLKGGGLSTKWKEEKVECTDCKAPSFRIIGGDKSFLICPHCIENRITQSS